jgi:hypothetical protein
MFSGIDSCSGECRKGPFWIFLKVGFQLGRTALLDTVPKRQFEGDCIVGRQFGGRSRSQRQFGWLGGILQAWSLLLLGDPQPESADRVGDILDQLLPEVLESQSAAMTQVIADAARNADLSTP